MARKEVIWSNRAHQDRLKILDYWIQRNKSTKYSKKLYQLFNSTIDLLAEHPEIGKPTDEHGVRAKIVKDYIIFYEIEGERLLLLTIWESHQDPGKLKNIIEKKGRLKT